VSQPFAPIAGAMEAAKGSAERTFGPAVGHAVDVASNLNPDFLPTALAKAAHYSPELAMAAVANPVSKPMTPEITAAYQIAKLLKEGKNKEITDELFNAADPQKLWELYENGQTGIDMPMDYNSRMQRAKNFGFTQKAYRGTNSKEIESKQLLTDRPEEGTKTYGTGSWVSNDPDIASTYTGSIENGPTVMPLLLKENEMKNIPWEGNLHFEGPAGKSTDVIARQERQKGTKGINIQNVSDTGPWFWNRANVQKKIPETSTTSVIMDPSIARSSFAIFDPRLEHLKNLHREVGGSVGRALSLTRGK
jgi:hypothetical protein